MRFSKNLKWAQLGPGAILPTQKKRREAPKNKLEEKSLQQLCEQYLNLKALFYIRIPDTLWRAINSPVIPIQVKKIVSDALKGLPDLTILLRGHYLAIELKSQKGKMTHEQERVGRAIGTILVRDFEHFKVLVDDFEIKTKGL